jgi:hypothetical protein
MVIDSMVLEFNLDPHQFTQAQRETIDGLRRMEYEAERRGGAIEAAISKMGGSFSVAKANALGLLGTFIGAEMVGALNNIAELDSRIGRAAKRSGDSVKDLSQWEGAVQAIGGSAGSATENIERLEDTINKVNMGAANLSPMAAMLFNRIGANVRTMTPHDVADLPMRLAEFFDRERAAGRSTSAQQASALRETGLFNQDMIDLILRGARAMRELRDSIKGATDESVEASNRFIENKQKIDQFFSNVFRSILDVFMYPFQSDDFHAKIRKQAEDAMAGKGPPGVATAAAGAVAAPSAGGLTPEFSAALARLQANMPPGMSFSITSGFRTRDEQAALFASRPALAAPPGHSRHELGMAADLKFSSPAAEAWAHAHGADFGVRFPVGREPWHAEPERGASFNERFGSMPGLSGRSSAQPPGSRTENKTANVTVSINKVEVNSARDAADVANGIDRHIERVAKAMPANYGLV